MDKDKIHDWKHVHNRKRCPICGGNLGCWYSVSRMRVICKNDGTGLQLPDIEGYLHVLPVNENGKPMFVVNCIADKVNSCSTWKKKEPTRWD